VTVAPGPRGAKVIEIEAVQRAESRWPAVAFAALLAGLFGALSLCAVWEPIVFDSWGNWARWRNRELDPVELWRVARDLYLAGNPRIGQVFTVSMYGSTLLHAIATPLVQVAMLYSLAALVLGRWPSPRRAGDVAIFALVAGMVLVAAPAPVAGAMFDYRPWTGNYILGFLLHLLVLLPYRFHLADRRPRHPLFAPLLLVLGVAAGLGNEHTGVASIALILAALIHFHRRGDRWAAWMLAGAIGLLIGYLLLLLAPGQDRRYGALMAQTSIPEVVLDRGFGNLRLLGLFALCAAALLPWVIAARLVRGTRLGGIDRWTIGTLLAAGAIIVFTSLASPQQGWRLLFAPMVLWIAATALWIYLRAAPRTLAIFGAATGALLAIQLTVMVYIQFRVHPVSEERLARITAAAPGSVVSVPPMPFGRLPWFVGDDLREKRRRDKVARFFRLQSVELERAR
jgi:Family of unknown function (DUF6056)